MSASSNYVVICLCSYAIITLLCFIFREEGCTLTVFFSRTAKMPCSKTCHIVIKRFSHTIAMLISKSHYFVVLVIGTPKFLITLSLRIRRTNRLILNHLIIKLNFYYLILPGVINRVVSCCRSGIDVPIYMSLISKNKNDKTYQFFIVRKLVS